MTLTEQLYDIFIEYKNKTAIFLDNEEYSYQDLLEKIEGIRKYLSQNKTGEQIFGIWITDNLECYASIFAIWFEGKAYVPLSPDSPYDRNEDIISQAGITTILSSENVPGNFNLEVILTNGLKGNFDSNNRPVKITNDTLMYVLFTSGTTGRPKGVPVILSNLTHFIEACKHIDLEINENDRCLQMFNMTFDMSIMSYLLCFLAGATLYPIPKGKIKFQFISELLESQMLTIAFMVPSILHYLRPYFQELEFPYLKYNLFAGEALLYDVVKEWSVCVPNAVVVNAYGPTENTIICTAYSCPKDHQAKTYNGILSIGKPMKNNEVIIVDENFDLVPIGTAGQMCLGGPQLTSGYWFNEEKNKESFFTKKIDDVEMVFYKSGDLCKLDEDGYIYYSGRIDFQAKIQGFRVELSEIEFHAKSVVTETNLVCVAFINNFGNTEIGMAFEADNFDSKKVIEYMKTKMPPYMIPTSIINLSSFPLNESGKIDRKEITKLFA